MLSHIDALESHIGALETTLRTLESRALRDGVAGYTAALPAARSALVAARLAYKRAEYLAEEFAPTVSRGLNGPPIPEIEDEEADRPLRPPEGLQVIEEWLWEEPPETDSLAAFTARLRREAEIAGSYVGRLRTVVTAVPFERGAVGHAARLQLATLMTLTLGGFDAPDEQRNVWELAESVRGLEAVLATQLPPTADTTARSAHERLMRALAAAQVFVDELPRDAAGHPDRFALLTRALRPAALALHAWQTVTTPEYIGGDALWRPTAATPYEVAAMDPWALQPWDAHRDTVLAPLGAALFHDVRLSGSRDRSCATCHDPTRAFADGKPVARAIGGASITVPMRNTPALHAAALQPLLLADGRLSILEDQVADVVHNAAEMGGDLRASAIALERDASTRAQFLGAFGGVDSSGGAVTPRRMQRAVAAYLRSLATLDAPFDRAVRGDTAAMAVDAREGFNVFMGKARCGTCHFAPTFAGVVPPRYTRGELEVIGVPASWPRVRDVDADVGRERIAGNPLHRFAFKTPSLREVARTAPYMHNGVLRTLDDVVAFYNVGGGAGLALDLPHQTLPSDSLHLTAREQRALVRFMESLSSGPSATHELVSSTRGTRSR
jgi:cytochrome c peroxidase